MTERGAARTFRHGFATHLLAGGSDIRTNHSKIWIMGYRGADGRIANATTWDCSFNTEFNNFPGNQEGATVFKNNRDVAVVYDHFFEAMKGNAPLRLVVDPAKAKFILTHPIYPYVTPQGRSFGSRDAFESSAQTESTPASAYMRPRSMASCMLPPTAP